MRGRANHTKAIEAHLAPEIYFIIIIKIYLFLVVSNICHRRQNVHDNKYTINIEWKFVYYKTSGILNNVNKEKLKSETDELQSLKNSNTKLIVKGRCSTKLNTLPFLFLLFNFSSFFFFFSHYYFSNTFFHEPTYMIT